MPFDYFYGSQADIFSFYRIPKNLFTEERFAGLSSGAKVLYGLMLDRTNLSAKNGWQDEHGRVYIVFSIDEVCEAMGVSNKTACKYMAELDTKNGIGLVERVRLGRGFKDRIYVLNFTTGNETANQQTLPLDADTVGSIPAENKNEKELETQADSQKCIFYTSRNVENTLLKNTQETAENQKCKKYTSRNVENTLLEVKKVHAISNTDFSDNDLNNTKRPISLISQSNNTGISMPVHDQPTDSTPRAYEAILTSVAEQIEADTLKEEYGDVIDEVVEVITDVMVSPATTIRVAGADRPTEVLGSQFARLTAAHVETALWNLRKHASEEITDIKAYMRTLLFDALLSMNIGIFHESAKI